MLDAGKVAKTALIAPRLSPLLSVSLARSRYHVPPPSLASLLCQPKRIWRRQILGLLQLSDGARQRQGSRLDPRTIAQTHEPSHISAEGELGRERGVKEGKEVW